MRAPSRAALPPGMSVLGGAAAGFSYEGALRDAMARRAEAWRDEGRRSQPNPGAMPPQQTQSGRPPRAEAQARRQHG